ncbi:DUF5753 domain-containing protein, partial [Streptomyces sp. NPDC051597]|uniref:DUF5753 domain-containing protein n=1 Tax=Streptomyces sp. NPDC051597 TaxID=3155049 RepID=UPI00344525B6
DIMREQLEHLNALGAEPNVTVQVLPYTVGAHPGLSGRFSILGFADTSAAPVVYLEQFTSDLYLEKPADVRTYTAMYAHLQAQALDPDSTHQLITDTIKTYTETTNHP